MFVDEMPLSGKSRGQSCHSRGRKGNTLIIVLIVLAIIAILAAMLLPALMRARQEPRKAVCKSHLKQVGVALLMYAVDHNESFPETLEQLAPTYLSQDILYCPCREVRVPGEIDYVYVKGLSLHSKPNDPIAFDRKGNHPEGRNVLCVDGHVEWLDEETFQARFGGLER